MKRYIRSLTQQKINIFISPICILLCIFTFSANLYCAGGLEDTFLGMLFPRPLSMGGVNTALSDDLSGISYNSAGTSLITQKTIGFSFGKQIKVGTNIISSGFLLPINEYGTLGFAFDRLGCGDLEERDSNGNLISTYSDYYNRFSSSYAIRIKKILSFGTRTSFVYRTFTENSSKDLLISFGGQIYPLAYDRKYGTGPLIFGFQVDDLSEDASFRFGLSYKYEYGHYKHFLISSDLGLLSSSKMLFFGVEFVPVSKITIRGGMDRLNPTLGFGYSSGEFDLDYSLQYQEFGTLHTFGFSLGIGEDWIEQKKNREFVDNALQSAMYYIQISDYEKAEEKLNKVLQVDRENVRARELLRSVEIEKLIVKGRDEYNQGELEDSLDTFEEAAEIDSKSKRIKGYISMIEEAIRLREEERKRQQEIKDLVTEGESLIKRGQYESALYVYREALKLDPDNPDILSSIDYLYANIGERVPEITEEIRNTYEEGLEMIEAGNYHDGTRLLEYVYSSVGNYKDVISQLNDSYFYLGMEAYGKGFLHDAVGYWNNILDKDPDNTEVLRMIERAESELEGMR